MDTLAPQPALARALVFGVAAPSTLEPSPQTSAGPPNIVTTDFLLKSLKDYTDSILKSFASHMSSLSQRVDVNSGLIAANAAPLTAMTKESFLDLELGRNFGELLVRARDIGMQNNQKKTQLLVISPPNSCITTAKFNHDGQTTTSVDKL